MPLQSHGKASVLVILLVCRWMVGGARNETFLFQDTLGEFANHSYTHAREWLAMQVRGRLLHGCVISQCHILSLSSVHTVPYVVGNFRGYKFSQNRPNLDFKNFCIFNIAVSKPGTRGLARGRTKSERKSKIVYRERWQSQLLFQCGEN